VQASLTPQRTSSSTKAPISRWVSSAGVKMVECLRRS
jgi:hypothetical protein